MEFVITNTKAQQSSTESFMDFVDRVLLLRSNMSDTKRFCITCKGQYFDDQRIKDWIATAIKCRVEELVLGRFANDEDYSDIMPVDLYTCESLTLLDIEFHYGTLHLPQTILFSRLKILRLSEISFCDEEFIQQLFSGCPVLEELSLKYCAWKDLNFISSTLKVLTLVDSLLRSEHKSVFPVITKIDAPNLMSLKIDDCLKNTLVVHSFPSLVDAHIRLSHSMGDDGMDVVLNFLNKLSNVKHLKVTGYIFEDLETANLVSTSLLAFTNLITLEVSIIKAEQVLIIDKANKDALTVDVVPHCLLMNLKSIKFQNFEGQRNELDLVKLFLQNAGVLQTVTIEISSNSLVNSKKKTHTAKDVEDFNKQIMRQLTKF
ncbi:putative F-box/FBD/LRR-repeat protein At2g05300 [Papaver somniferum]|uniref:putative F-box/FBD/LRR-repeat protein At2g05300 n=1 Tax=Papaver somniferum TaxID=3469 RepID=UPI000E70165F|nr:putative F-box/FBD/LRR-repeat protein At2g05300 [Papaver somniferum]